MCPTTLLQMLAQPRRMSSIKFHSSTAKHVTLFIRHHARIEDHTPFFCIMLTLRRYTHESPGSQYFPKLELDSTSSPPAPKTNVDTNINVKNRTRRCAINLRGFSFAQHPILKFQGQGDTHRVKMKSKASSQTTDAVVAEWQSACETHGFAILSQTLRSVLTLPAT